MRDSTKRSGILIFATKVTQAVNHNHIRHLRSQITPRSTTQLPSLAWRERQIFDETQQFRQRGQAPGTKFLICTKRALQMRSIKTSGVWKTPEVAIFMLSVRTLSQWAWYSIWLVLPTFLVLQSLYERGEGWFVSNAQHTRFRPSDVADVDPEETWALPRFEAIRNRVKSADQHWKWPFNISRTFSGTDWSKGSGRLLLTPTLFGVSTNLGYLASGMSREVSRKSLLTRPVYDSPRNVEKLSQ